MTDRRNKPISKSAPRILLPAAAAMATLAAIVLLASSPRSVEAAYGDLYFPLLLDGFEGSFPEAPTSAPPTATATAEEATTVPTGTSTRGPTATQGPEPTPTLPGSEVKYPKGSGTIVMQIGWTETDQPGEVWEEMNGTPWLTLYGDGRLIAGTKLLDPKHELHDSQIDEHTIQMWLRRLTHEVMFFQMHDKYEHSRGSKPVMHVYVNTIGGEQRVEIRGFKNWENVEEPDVPDRFRVVMLIELLRDIEAFTAAQQAEPYEVEWYTVLAQRTDPKMMPGQLPRFVGPVNVSSVARAAPTAASNYVNRVVGHKFVSAEVGKEVDDFVTPISLQQWVFYNMAAELSAGGRSHAVGARREVPGGPLFLPSEKRAFWYRSDAGSGRPPYPLMSPGEQRIADRYEEQFLSE